MGDATRLSQIFPWVIAVTAAAAPFAFGAVERRVWAPLCAFWMLCSIAAFLLATDVERRETSSLARLLLPLHSVFALQLIPLPAAMLAWLSPGTYAARFLSEPVGVARWHPLSVSPAATVEAWWYATAIASIFLGVRLLRDRERGLWLVLIATTALGAEGLWQSRSDHPYRLLGFYMVHLPSGLDTAVFGPYFNRNHFATVTALGSAVAAGMASGYVMRAGGLGRVLHMPTTAALSVLCCGAASFLVLATAASGSRSGLLAAFVGIAFLVARRLPRRWVIVLLAAASISLLLADPLVLQRLTRTDIVASRLRPWEDMLTLLRFFPMFGSGLGTFSVAYWPYQRNATYEYWVHAHNEYLQFLTETGLVGFVLLCLAIRRFRAYVIADLEWSDVLCGASVAFATQAFFDFPSRIPANLALFTVVAALTLSLCPTRAQRHALPAKQTGRP